MQLYGTGSELARMFKRFFDNNRISDVFGCSLDDSGSGVKAAGTFVIGGTATADGSFVAYVGGERVPIAVTSGMTADQVGVALAAAIQGDSEKPVTAANVGGTVTCTAKNAGEGGNGIDLRINYNAGEELPAGITCAVNGSGTQGTLNGGANNPDIQDVIDILGDEWYNIICAPYWDATNMTAIETEMTDRFGPLRMIDGLYLTSRMGTVGTLESWGNGKNSPHVSVLHSQKIPGVSAEVASAYAGQIAKEGQADPARPFQTLELVNILPPAVEHKFTLAENNALLYDGISTFYVDSGGKVRVQRAITQYQKNAVGADDIAYLDVNTMLTLMFMRYDFRTQILTKYSRAKLADDGVQVGPGQQVMTPKLGKSEAINIFRGWELLGLAENIDQFKNDLICERSATDPNRLNWILPPDLINQFRIGAATIQFLLQSPTV
jgi:phage tail sheath gpL-like